MRYLGLDLGTKSLGLAISDKSNMISLPFNTLHFKEENYQDVLLELDKIVKEKEITAFVLGLPKNMNNSLGFASERSLKFKSLLEERFSLRFPLSWCFWDRPAWRRFRQPRESR